MEILLYVLVALLASIVAALYIHLRRVGDSVQQLENELSASAAEIKEKDQEIKQLTEKKVEAEVRLSSQIERAEADAERERQSEERMREQFKNIASDLFAKHSSNFKEVNRESIDLLLKPFKDNITQFRERVETIYATENEQRGALKSELKSLMELNRVVTAETVNLTNALKGESKVQGDWGEMILESILDSSNLIKGIHYDTQLNVKSTEGDNLRPDVVLYLPDNKQIIIDSKVSLTSFVAYSSAEDAAQRKALISAHLLSVRRHVAELGDKGYQKLLNSPDFVIMFIPNEPAFLAALQGDNGIWSEAYDKKVVISSPTNLFALLKLVDDLWRRNAQSKNTADIVNFGTKLYDQLVNFTTSLEGVGKALDQAKERYDDAYKRLSTGRDNIIRNGERLRALGLPAKRRHSAKALEGNEIEGNEIEESSQPQ
ncbi:MAG: DNA recombination protein RmuC [Rikenellaceae bacterium]